MNKVIYWTPRILAIIFIAFLAVFSLDVFDGNYGFWSTVIALFMHNIPVFILAAVLWIAWRREIVATIVFALGGILYIFQMVYNVLVGTGEWYMLSYSIIIAGPAFLISYLFYLNWRWRKKK